MSRTVAARERRSAVPLSVLLRVGGAIALLALMALTSWFGLSTPAAGSFGAAGSTAAGVWTTLHVTRWLLVLAAAGALLSVPSRHRAAADAALVLGLIATAVLFYRLLIVLPDPDAVLDVKVGGYLALVACGALTVGAYEAEAAPRAIEQTGDPADRPIDPAGARIDPAGAQIDPAGAQID